MILDYIDNITLDEWRALVWKTYFTVLVIYIAVIWAMGLLWNESAAFVGLVCGTFGWTALAIILGIWLHA